MSLENAHWKLSNYAAQAAGIQDRGHLGEGMPADVIVYDYNNLRITEQVKLFDQPAGEWRLAQKAEGYKFTIVNGEITFEDGRCTGATPGKLLRHGRA